ncbi:hypothetical protein Dsin_010579 [Dipteronia sinensis]|uniref:Acetyl-CoA carboxylase beta subunit n=1 Tax=Dipteronia sinensis TaxID=43782 RepID=A0AAE0ECZ1_9ROSI|nr:hypothetical protein Dsin_010579 [Dipteronia sinensis]
MVVQFDGGVRIQVWLSKSIDRLGPIKNKNTIDRLGPIKNKNTSVSEGPVRNDKDKNIHSWGDSSSYSSVHHLVSVRDIRNFFSYDTFFIRDSNRDSYFIYFDIENQILELTCNIYIGGM